MSHAEIDDLLFERRRVRLCLGAEHEPLRGRRTQSVRFDRKVVVIAHDKGHLGKLLAGLTVQDGVEVVEGFSPFHLSVPSVFAAPSSWNTVTGRLRISCCSRSAAAEPQVRAPNLHSSEPGAATTERTER